MKNLIRSSWTKLKVKKTYLTFKDEHQSKKEDESCIYNAKVDKKRRARGTSVVQIRNKLPLKKVLSKKSTLSTDHYREVFFVLTNQDLNVTPIFQVDVNRFWMYQHGRSVYKQMSELKLAEKDEIIKQLLVFGISLERRKILHQDLKWANFLWNGKKLLLIDWASAIHVTEWNTLQSARGSKIAQPPEYFGDLLPFDYDFFEGQRWSIANLILSLLLNDYPMLINDCDEIDLKKKIDNCYSKLDVYLKGIPKRYFNVSHYLRLGKKRPCLTKLYNELYGKFDYVEPIFNWNDFDSKYKWGLYFKSKMLETEPLADVSDIQKMANLLLNYDDVSVCYKCSPKTFRTMMKWLVKLNT